MISSFIAALSPQQAQIAHELRELILAAHPSITEGYRYRVPFFRAGGWFCYLNPLKSGGMDLSFLQGSELADPYGILEARDRKQVRSIVVSADSPDRNAILSVLYEAIELNLQTQKQHARRKRIA